MNRRSFVKAAAATVGGLSLGLAGCTNQSEESGSKPETMTVDLREGRSIERVGLQLYTVRTLLADDFDGVLERIAAIGYRELEFAGYHDQPPEAVRATLDRLGLTAPSAHIPLARWRNEMDTVIAEAQTVGHRYLVLPWLAEQERQTLDQYREYVALSNEAGRRCTEAGIQFAYHNHEFEFVPIDGVVPYELLITETDPALVQLEMDVYWMTVAGQDPFAYFDRFPGRFPMCHVKDYGADGSIVPVGEGSIDFASIFARQEEAGLKHFFVEHDNPADPMASITTSFAALQQLRF